VKALLRSILDRAARSPRMRGLLAGTVGAHLTELDRDFLKAIPDGTVVDLDRQLAMADTDPSLPSLLWSVLWEASARGAVEPGLKKRVEYRLAGKTFKMELDLGESPECGYLLRNPTPMLTGLLRAGGDLCLDIGANAGFHALTAGLFFKKVVAIEPTPATAERLRTNVVLSGFWHVRVEPIALGDADGEATLAVTPGHCGTNRIADGGRGGVRVPVRTLDALAIDAEGGLAGHRVDFIKIDVEGHERAVLAGGRETIARDRPDLFVEFNSAAAFEGFAAMLPKGYRAMAPIGTKGQVRAIERTADAVAVRDVLFRGR
jgi:FkbM family methyltransferase